MLCLGFPRGFHQRVKRKNHIKILILGFSRKKSGSWVHVPTRQPLAGARTAHFQSSVRPWFSRFYHPSPLGPHVETRALIPCLEAPHLVDVCLDRDTFATQGKSHLHENGHTPWDACEQSTWSLTTPPTTGKIQSRSFQIYSFFFCPFAICWAAPAAYEGSQARGWIGAAATSLHHSHSNAGSEPRLQPATQLTTTLDP